MALWPARGAGGGECEPLQRRLERGGQEIPQTGQALGLLCPPQHASRQGGVLLLQTQISCLF